MSSIWNYLFFFNVKNFILNGTLYLVSFIKIQNSLQIYFSAHHKLQLYATEFIVIWVQCTVYTLIIS